jgi:hypothetical protein
VCAYAACWGPTDSRGWLDVDRVVKKSLGLDVSYLDSWTFDPPPPPEYMKTIAPLVVECRMDSETYYYYFWFFGYVAKLPYETSPQS